MSKTLRIGIIGCGGIARFHVRSYSQLDDVQITQVYDVIPASAQKMADEVGAKAAASLEALIESGEVDAVSLCTPPAGKVPIVKALLDAGIAILSEKPLAINVDEAQQITDLVSASGVVFMSAFCHRFHGPIIELKRLIEDGTIGRPLLFRNLFAGYLALEGNHRALPEVSGGGCLIDHCTHSLDLYRFLVGEPVRIDAMRSNVLQDVAVEDLGSIQLMTADGAIGQIASSYSLRSAGSWLEVVGENGAGRISYWNKGYADLTVRKADEKDSREVDCSSHPDRFVTQLAHFVESVRSSSTPSVTVDDGLAVNKLVAQAYASANA